jgi:hypothetical protein
MFGNQFTAVGGEIYGQLFENVQMDVPRNVYWACKVEFSPMVDEDGGEWACSLLCEWLVWPIRRWRELDGISLAQCVGKVKVEASLYYLSKHQPIRELNRAGYSGELRL